MDEWRLTVTIAGYLTVVAPVILLYDYIITMADEVSESRSLKSSNHTVHLSLQVRLIWPGPLAFPKLLYYINRYISIAMSLYCVSASFLPPVESKPWFPWLFFDVNVRNFHPTIRIPDLQIAIRCLSFPFLYGFGFMWVIQVSNVNPWIYFYDDEQLCHGNDRNR